MATRRRSLFDDGTEVVLDPWEAQANPLRDLLEERGAERLHVQTRRLSLRAWADKVPEQRGPLDFRTFAWQEELYGPEAADDREQVYMKGTQVGVTTQALRWALYHADVHQRVVLYTFPTDNELTDFSRQRIRPVLRASEHLMSRMRGDAVNNVGQKEIGPQGWIYFRGTQKPIDSIPADVVVFDEVDTSDQANIEASERRVTGPMSAGLIRRIGVPSIPGFGISALFDASDQRVWVVRCGCGEHNPMRGLEAFEANLDQDLVQLVCRREDCQRPLDIRVGEWVATYPDRDVRGYHIPKLLFPGRRNLAVVIANSKKAKDYQRTAFFTRDLGVPYAPAEGRLSIEQIRACQRPDLRPVHPRAPAPTHAPRFMGIDVASVRALNVTIEEEVDRATTTGRKLWVGEIEDDPAAGNVFTQLCRLMDTFNISMAGIDDGPEGRLAIAFAARYPGRVYRVSFFEPTGKSKKAPEPWAIDDDAQFVSLWRTRAYDATFERFRMQHVLLPALESLGTGHIGEVPAYAAHLGNLYRQKLELPTGGIQVRYIKTGPEDYAQAEAYCLAAIEVFWRNVGLGLALGSAVPVAAVGDPYERHDDDEREEAEEGYRSAFS